MADDARPPWSPAQAEQIGRACLAAAEALAALGEALVGGEVLDRIEREDMPPEERAIADALAGDCSDPPCGPHHEHYTPAGRANV